jgi:hypothetical protein
VTAAGAVAAAAVVSAGSPVTAATPDATTPPPTTCSTVVKVNGLAFDPPSVPAGGTSTATLTATDCTGLPQTVTETWQGRFTSGSSTGIPAGCPAVDPLPRSVTFAPYQRVATSTGYLVFAGCTADRFHLTVTISQGGVQLTTATADLLIG